MTYFEGATLETHYRFVRWIARRLGGRLCFVRYLIDTVRCKMMMTSGEAVKYNGSLDAFG
jgi:hypothetical protein